MLLSPVYFVKVIYFWEVIDFFLLKARDASGLFFVILKQGTCSFALKIKFAKDQENSFHFHICVNKV